MFGRKTVCLRDANILFPLRKHTVSVVQTYRFRCVNILFSSSKHSVFKKKNLFKYKGNDVRRTPNLNNGFISVFCLLQVYQVFYSISFDVSFVNNIVIDV